MYGLVECIDEWVDGCMDERTDGWMDKWTYGLKEG